jgi:hypothetical protein
MHPHLFLNAMLHLIPPETPSQALNHQSTQLSSPLLIEIKRIPTQRASTSITGPKPLEQTASMEHMLASRAALLRQLAIPTNNTVANRTLTLALQRTRNIAAERRDAIGDRAVRERDNALAVPQPALPFFLFDSDAADADDLCGSQRVSLRQDDFDRHGLLVDDVRDVDFFAAHADFDAPLFVLGVFFGALLVPLGDAL